MPIEAQRFEFCVDISNNHVLCIRRSGTPRGHLYIQTSTWVSDWWLSSNRTCLVNLPRNGKRQQSDMHCYADNVRNMV